MNNKISIDSNLKENVTTDNEIWDIYDKNRKKLNKTIIRDSNQKLQDGEYHLVVEAIIVNSKNEILISKRSATKKKYPLYWECNGGSVKSGENSKQGILRELKEELGLNFNESEAIFYKEEIVEKSHAIKDTWLFKKDINLSDIHFTDNEATEAKWVTIDKMNEMEQSGEFIPGRAIKKDNFNKILKYIENNLGA